MKKVFLISSILVGIAIISFIIFNIFPGNSNTGICASVPNYNSMNMEDYKTINSSECIGENSFEKLSDNSIVIFDDDPSGILIESKIYPLKSDFTSLKKLGVFKYENANVLFYISDIEQKDSKFDIISLIKKSASIYDRIIKSSHSDEVDDENYSFNLMGSFIVLTPLQQDNFVFRAYLVYGRKGNGITNFYSVRKDFALIYSKNNHMNNKLMEYESTFIKDSNNYRVDLISPFPDLKSKTSILKYKLPLKKSWDIRFSSDYDILPVLDIEKDSVKWNVSNKAGLLKKSFYPLDDFSWSQFVNIESNVGNKITKIKEYEKLNFKNDIENKSNSIGLGYNVQIEN